MSFLNAVLAFGAAAFVIPLIIHLLFRNRFKVVRWGAMFLLTDAVVAKRRRFQLTDILLLIVRCAIPVLLAICLARPVLTNFDALPGDAPQTFILVVDDSRSMMATEPNDVVRLEKAKQQLFTLLQQQSRRDEVILVPASNAEEIASKMGIQEAVTKISSMTAQSGPVSVGRMVRAGVDNAREASHPHRHVVVVSDFQSNIVDDAAIESVDACAAAVRTQPLPPAFSFISVARQTDRLQNVSVDSVRVDAPAVVSGRATPFDAKIRNASDQPVRNVRVVWSIDDEPAKTDSIDLQPRSSAIARTRLRLDRTGSHRVSLTVEHDDSLRADNRRTLRVNVLDQVNVLLINGDPSKDPLKGETDYLAIALSPFSFNPGDRPDPIRTDTISSTQFANQVRSGRGELSGMHVVILANVQQIDTKIRSHLAAFVLGGGALVVFDGDRLDPETYNRDWGAALPSDEEGPMRLPATMGGIRGGTNDRSDGSFRIGKLNPGYSPWNNIAGDKQTSLRRIDIRTYRELQPRGDRPDAKVQTLLRLAGGEPLVVSGSYGNGRVIQFAIPSDPDWTTFPLRPVFVPMMHQMVMDLAGNGYGPGGDVSEVPASESELRDVTTPRLQSLADSLGAGVFTDVKSFQTAEQTRRFGREIWRPLLAAVLAALVIEVILQQRRSAVKTPAVAT